MLALRFRTPEPHAGAELVAAHRIWINEDHARKLQSAPQLIQCGNLGVGAEDLKALDGNGGDAGLQVLAGPFHERSRGALIWRQHARRVDAARGCAHGFH